VQQKNVSHSLFFNGLIDLG